MKYVAILLTIVSAISLMALIAVWIQSVIDDYRYRQFIKRTDFTDYDFQKLTKKGNR